MLDQNQQIIEQINKANHVLVTFGKSNAEDALVSALAFATYLKKLGKTVDIAAELTHGAAQFDFLIGYADIKAKLEGLRRFIISLDISNTKVGPIDYRIEKDTVDFIVTPEDGFFTHNNITSKNDGYKYDLIVVLGTRDLEDLGAIYNNDTDFFYETPIINIDNSPANENFGQINLINLNAVSTAEVLFTFFTNYDRNLIDEQIATSLLTGIITATRSFKTSNVSPATLSIASELVTLGARREDIVNRLYRSRNINILKLWGVALARLQASADSNLVWSAITYEDFLKTKTTPDALVDVIDELIVNIPNAKIIALFYEDAHNDRRKTKAIINGVKNLDVQSLLRELNPQGSKSLATVESLEPIVNFERQVTGLLTEKIKRLLA